MFFPEPAKLSSSSSSSSASVRVDKATSDLLIGPDWTINLEICDSINSHHWPAKDVVKAVKKRLQHKSPKVQLLSLTLLETMIKNCGDNVHFQIAERNIMQEMIKIVRKKTEMQVRHKILVLIDSWQEAFGGPGGKYPQYYWAYEELRRSGVEFPQRSRDAAPIFTPPVAHPMIGHSQAGYGMPSNSSTRLDEAMASEMDNLSLSNLESMRSVVDLLADMLYAVNRNDREAIKDEVIVDLVSRCRSNQKKLIQMLTSTSDEELLGQGIELNDSLQSLLAKHDAIASGSVLPTEVKDYTSRSSDRRDSSPRPTEAREPSAASDAASSSTPMALVTSSQLEEEEDEDDDFAQLARRGTKNRPMPSESTSTGISEGSAAVTSNGIAGSAATLTSNPSNELALPTPPTSVRTTAKEQDMIDLLSITLSTTSTSPHTPHTPPSTSGQNTRQVPVSPTTQGYQYGPQPYSGNQGQVPFNNYVAPWAQPQPEFQSASQFHPHLQQQQQPQFPQYSYNYPPPPWATGPANPHQTHAPANNPSPFLTPRANTPASYMPMNMARPLQSYNSFPTRTNDGSALYGETQINSTQHSSSPAARQKPFVPSYRLFEDLNVLGNADGASPKLSGMSGQSMVGGRK